MGSDPQFSKFPNLALAQHIFSVANSPQTSQTSLQYIQNAIKEHKMAPLYRHLAHPTEGVLNTRGEGTAAAATTQSTPPPSTRRGSLVSSNLLPSRKSLSSGLIPWDESLYEELKADNEKELEAIQKEEQEAEENAGTTEVQAARGKRAEFWARVGDKDMSIEAYEAVFEKAGPLGTKIDIVLAIIRIGLFYNDRVFSKKQIERANILVENGGDWDRRNKMKTVQGLYLLTIRSYNLAAPLLLDSLATFTSYELCSYSELVMYAVLAGTVALGRTEFKTRVVDAPEIKAILGSGEEKLPGADEEMQDVSAATPGKAAVVNLASLGTGQAEDADSEQSIEPLASLVRSLYEGSYKNFFRAIVTVDELFLQQNRYLFEHKGYLLREYRLKGYTQFLSSYRVVGLKAMADAFGISESLLEMDLRVFISGGRISGTIDKIQGIVETTRPDFKGKQYLDIVKQGDGLITKLQKYSATVRLRGSERA